MPTWIWGLTGWLSGLMLVVRTGGLRVSRVGLTAGPPLDRLDSSWILIYPLVKGQSNEKVCRNESQQGEADSWPTVRQVRHLLNIYISSSKGTVERESTGMSEWGSAGWGWQLAHILTGWTAPEYWYLYPIVKGQWNEKVCRDHRIKRWQNGKR